MDTLRKDVSFALRGLARSPGFVAVIVATLGLGIGANVAIFTVVDGMMLEALPYRDPRGVVRIWDTKLSQGWDESSISPLNFRDWQERNRTFDDMAIFQGRSYNLSDEGEPERIRRDRHHRQRVRDPRAARPSLGRDFRDAGGRPRRRAGGDPERSAVAAALRRQSRDRRLDAAPRRRRPHRRGRHADSTSSSPSPDDRRLDADGVPHRARSARQPQLRMRWRGCARA